MTGLRALAAGWVVVHHFRPIVLELMPATQPLKPLLANGYIGVEIFFVLSGFIISHNYGEKFRFIDRGTYRTYVVARLARVYPVHVLTLVVMGALVVAASLAGVTLTSEGRNTTVNFLANFVLLQAVPEFRPFNSPAWSISCEFAAYLVFPLIAVATVRLPRVAAFALAAAVALVGVAGFGFLVATGNSWSLSYPMMWWRICVGFVTGSLLWAGWRHGVRPSWAWDVVAVSAAGGVAGALLARPGDDVIVFMTFPLLALFVLSCACLAGPVGRLLSARWTVWLGRVSYSLYMTHFMVFLILKKIFPWRSLVASGLLIRVGYLLVCVGLVVGVAALTYYLVEEPGRRLVRRRSVAVSAAGVAR